MKPRKKKKSKEGRPTEFYKSIIRSLKKEVKQLRQRIREVEGYHPQVDNEPEPEPVKFELCQNCGKGHLMEVVVVGRMLKSCQLCGWRSKAIKV